jgi:ParB-like chromosome segregation protein Spo0J
MSALSDLEYGSLKSSIQEHGQPFPIVVNQDGVILDGHHRYKACHELGIKPSVLVRQFENRLQEKKFIIEVNRSRRHLNEFQRIELQIKLESIESEIAKERMSHKIGA